MSLSDYARVPSVSMASQVKLTEAGDYSESPECPATQHVLGDVAGIPRADQQPRKPYRTLGCRATALRGTRVGLLTLLWCSVSRS